MNSKTLSGKEVLSGRTGGLMEGGIRRFETAAAS